MLHRQRYRQTKTVCWAFHPNEDKLGFTYLRRPEFISGSHGHTRLAFTLAEVLITLGIIGIVAAMTIPSLIANYKKTQYVAQLKKAYSQFNQALNTMASDNGCSGDLRCMSEWGGGDSISTDLIGNIIYTYFKVVKNCKSNSNQGCFPSRVNNKYDGTGTFVTLDSGSGYRFITADGTAFSIYSAGNNCVGSYSNYKLMYMSKVCGTLTIDVNGPKNGPNYYGRDIFNFAITNGKGAILYPYGGIDDGLDGTWAVSGMNGFGCNHSDTNLKVDASCAARIIENNWVMDY